MEVLQFKTNVGCSDNSPEYTERYCRCYIVHSEYLWDLRFWKNDHNYDEVGQFIYDLSMYREGWINDGHVKFCVIHLLKYYKWSIDEIANLFMQNKNVSHCHALGSSFFCQVCGKSSKKAFFFTCCSECLKLSYLKIKDHNKYNLLKNSLGEFGWIKNVVNQFRH